MAYAAAANAVSATQMPRKSCTRHSAFLNMVRVFMYFVGLGVILKVFLPSLEARGFAVLDLVCDKVEYGDCL